MDVSYLEEVRNDFIILMVRDGYNLSDISFVFNLKVSSLRKIIKETPLSYKTKWIRRPLLIVKNRKAKNGVVYFIQQDNNEGHIKIGFTQQDVNKRRLSLQSNCQSKLNVLCAIKGTDKLEKRLHKKFQKDRLYSEWFSPSKDILDFIKDKKTWPLYRSTRLYLSSVTTSPR